MTKNLSEKIEAIMRKYTPGDFTHFKPAAEDIVALFQEEENRRLEELRGKIQRLYPASYQGYDYEIKMLRGIHIDVLDEVLDLLRSTKNEV